MNARNMRAVLSGIAVLTFASAAHAVPPSSEGSSGIAGNDGIPGVEAMRSHGPLPPPFSGNTAQGGVFVNTGADDCPDATVVPVAVGPRGSPNTVTILGDNSAASGTDCLRNAGDHGWWESFQIDTFADATIDFCGTDPVRRPDWALLYTACGCFGDLAPDSFDRTTTCPFNISFTFLALPPGTYYYPVFTVPGDKRCEDSGNSCDDSSECGAGYTCQDNLHPYTMHITAEAALGSCCSLGGSGQCVAAGVCQGGFNDGGFCVDNADCPGGGICTGISNTCIGGPYNGQPCNTDDDCTQPPSCVGEVLADNCPEPDRWSPGLSCCETECRELPPVGPEFDSLNVTLLSLTPLSAFPDSQYLASAVSQYVSPAGQEYGILTLTKGTGFVRLTNPVSPVVVGYIDGEGIEGIHREVQTYGEYAYVVTDDGPGVGLQVIDLTQIDSNLVTLANTTQLGVGFQTAHTLFPNRDSGYLYLNSANHTGRDGLVVLDLNANPVEPPIVGTWIDPVPDIQCHDSTVVTYTTGPYAGREIAFCFAENDGVVIVDVTDKSNMFQLSSAVYPNLTYCHQGWPTEDRKFLFINDEADETSGAVSQTTSYIVNIQDLSNPFFVTSFSNGLCATDHNEMVRGKFLFEANYSTGLRVFSVCDVNNVREIGYFDTHPEHNAVGFDGMWGVDTRLPSGIVVTSDRQRGLFVFDVSAALASVDGNDNGVDDACDIDCFVCVSGPMTDARCASDADCLGEPCLCARRFVDGNAAGLNDGTTWSDAYRYLQDALAYAAAFPGTVHDIWVADGTYTPDRRSCVSNADCLEPGNAGVCQLGTCAYPNPRELSFRLVDDVSIIGGFAGDEFDFRQSRPSLNVTVLSGDLGGNDNPSEFPNGPTYAENSYNVLNGSGTANLAGLTGFTITGGNANGGGGLGPHRNGGGIYIDAGTPDIRVCRFVRNNAGEGGAMFNQNASPLLIGCTFEDNAATFRGGAMSNEPGSPYMVDIAFRRNTSQNAAAIFSTGPLSSPFILVGTFEDNTGTVGGALDIVSDAHVTIETSSFTGNSAFNGGAIRVYLGSVSLSGCTFTSNNANLFGGAVYVVSGGAGMNDCLFEQNHSDVAGGGIYSDGDSVSNLSDCTFTGNTAVDAGGGLVIFGSPSGVTVSRCTFDGNTNSAPVGVGGGGVYVSNAGGGRSIDFVNCRFMNNVSGSQGGGLTGGDAGSELRLVNCLFSGNAANNGSGALISGMNTTLLDSTIAGNTSSEVGAGLYVLANPPATATLTVANSILWNNVDGVPGTNEADQLVAVVPLTALIYSLVQGLTGDYNGVGNIDADPLFVNPLGGDFRLLSGSPAIDAGDINTLPYDSADLDGDAVTAEQLPLDLADGLRVLDDPLTIDTGSAPASTQCDATSPNAGQPCTSNADCAPGACICPNPPYCDIVDMGAYEYAPDCNFNGEPDECDISCDALGGSCLGRPFCGTSSDSDMDGVPDECFTSSGGGSFSSAVPDDEHIVLESAAAITTWTVDADKRISSLVMKKNTALRVTGGHLSFKAPELVGTGDPTPMILHGTMEVGGAFTIGKPDELLGHGNPQPMIVSPGGVFSAVDPTPNAPPVTAELYAGTVVVKPGLGSAGLSGGRVELTQQMKLFVEQDLILEGGDPDPMAAASTASVAGISPPPKLIFFTEAAAATGSAASGPPPVTLSTAKGLVTASLAAGTPGTRIDVRGSIRIVEAVELGGDGEVLLGGDFDNRTTYPSLVDLSLSNMVLDGTVTHTFEVGGLDLGAVEEGFATDRDTLFDSAPHKNYSIGHLKVSIVASAGAASDWAASPLVRLDPIVVFTNRFANTAGAGPCQEALYVDTLEVEPDTKVALDNVRIYYRTLIAPGVSFERIGCGDVVQIVIGPIADPTGIDKPRFISFSVPGGGETALRVNLTTLHDVVPPYTAGASIAFTAFEGESMWVGPPVQYVESVSSGVPFYASKLQCDPYYQDWSTVGLLAVTGEAIVPSSSYSVENLAASCLGQEATAACLSGGANVSTALAIATTRWGDVVASFQLPTPPVSQPDFTDIGALVNKFKSAPGAPIKARALLAGEGARGLINLTPDLGFGHISACVDGFKGLPYPYKPGKCTGAQTMACITDTDCGANGPCILCP